jgi:uncharacterized protein (TIGR02266 family)
MSTAENRKSPRVNAPHVLVKISSRDRFRSSYLKDLSEGGLFVKTEKAMPSGAELVIDLLPPGWTDTLRLRGIVVRAQNTPGNAGMAVRFENNEEASMEVLRTLVNDYQNGPGPGEVRAEDPQEQLQRVLGQVAELKNALAKRDAELAAEKTKREEASRRAVVLTAELEIAKTTGGNEPREVASRLTELETELATSQHEEMELRTRLAEVEGELDAFKHENETLEQDDATSRRLASGLAKEKAELTAENARLSASLADAKAKLATASKLAEERAADLESRGQNERLLTEKLRTITTEVDDLRLRASGLEAKSAELDVERTASKQKLERVEREAANARAELTAATKRATVAEAAAKEAQAKAERSRAKERELRDLLTIVTGKSPAGGSAADDVVVFDEKPSMPPPTSTSPSVIASEFEEPALELETPESMPSVAISFEHLETGDSDFAPSPSGIELSVDVDVDESPAPPAPPVTLPAEPGLDRSTFERKLRGNEPLTKTDRFDTHAPRDEREQSVLGLLQAGGRFSELMVLGRGVVAPAELIDALYTLLTASIIRFEEPKAK